jgi:hypothetical protein
VDRAEKGLVLMSERMKEAEEELNLLRNYLEGNLNQELLVEYWKSMKRMYIINFVHLYIYNCVCM